MPADDPPRLLVGWWPIWFAVSWVFVLVVLGVGQSLVAATDLSVDAGFHPRRILLQPNVGTNPDALAGFHAAGQRRVLRTFSRLDGLQVVQLPEGETVPEAVARYQQSGLVNFAEPDYRVSAAATLPDDPRFQDGTLWGLNNYGQNAGLPDADLDAPEAWDVLHSASNVIVALIDSGVRLTHEDLAANLWTNPVDGSHGIRVLTNDIAGTWLVDTNASDDFGHGTHLAGIVGAVGSNNVGVVGVAWQVQIMACKFLDNFGNGFNSDAVTCMEFARSNGAQVINLSWGGTNFSAAVSNAIRAAQSDGIIFAAAAGNQARNNDLTPYYPASLALDNVVAVGASTRTDSIWTSSNYGANHVDLFAPGAVIFSTRFAADNAYANMNGTSMATAYVAGALALLRAQSPAAPYRELIERLLSAVNQRPAFAGKCATGGRLNLLKALDRATVSAAGNQSPGEPFEVRVSGVPGHSYVLQASTNLNAWTSLQTNNTSPNGTWLFSDPESPSLPQRFYRGIVGP